MDKKELNSKFESINKELLTAEQLNIVQLYLTEDLSEKEISERMKIPVGQAKQKIARAVYQLRKVANDPEFVKARNILYGHKPEGTNDHDDQHNHFNAIDNDNRCS